MPALRKLSAISADKPWGKFVMLQLDYIIYINYIIYIIFIPKRSLVTHDEIFKCIVDAVNDAPRNRQTAELHIQMIKYADELKSITSKEFCEETKLPIGYGSEFSKMRNITERLKAAGLDVSKL
jgi:hypothetical protein